MSKLLTFAKSSLVALVIASSANLLWNSKANAQASSDRVLPSLSTISLPAPEPIKSVKSIRKSSKTHPTINTPHTPTSNTTNTAKSSQNDRTKTDRTNHTAKINKVKNIGKESTITKVLTETAIVLPPPPKVPTETRRSRKTAKTEPKIEAQTEPKTEAQTEPKTEAQTEAKTELKTKPTNDSYSAKIYGPLAPGENFDSIVIAPPPPPNPEYCYVGTWEVKNLSQYWLPLVQAFAQTQVTTKNANGRAKITFTADGKSIFEANELEQKYLPKSAKKPVLINEYELKIGGSATAGYTEDKGMKLSFNSPNYRHLRSQLNLGSDLSVTGDRLFSLYGKEGEKTATLPYDCLDRDNILLKLPAPKTKNLISLRLKRIY